MAADTAAGQTELARHTIFRDRPDLAFPAVRDFIFQIKESQPAS
jgi:hypothetical protein